MDQSKFIKTFDKLDKVSQRRYIEFLDSPYFNKNEEVRQFVALIRQGKASQDPKKIYEFLYPGKPFDARRLHDLLYKSLKLLEEFLTEEQYATQTWDRKLNLLNYIRVNELEDLNSVVQREIRELSAKKQFRDSNYFYEEFMYQSEAYKIFLDQAQIKGDENLQKKVDRLDLFYLSAKLRDSCEMMNRKRILSIDYEFHLLNNLIEAIKADFERYKSYPAISIYYRILLMLMEPEDTGHFRKLQEEFQQNIGLFPQDEQRSLYGYLQNYCIRKVNSGAAAFYSELFDIYEHMLLIGLMDPDNKNLQWELKNMVSVALRLGKYERALDIVETLKTRLPEEVSENAYAYNLANYYYETKNFRKATLLLHSVDFKDVYYNLDSKSMLLKIYFEQDEEEAFFALVNTFQVFLTRNRLISTDTHLAYSNLLKFARKAFVFKTMLPYQRRHSSHKIRTLNDKLTRSKNVINLAWLLKETDKLMEDAQ